MVYFVTDRLQSLACQTEDKVVLKYESNTHLKLANVSLKIIKVLERPWKSRKMRHIIVLKGRAVLDRQSRPLFTGSIPACSTCKRARFLHPQGNPGNLGFSEACSKVASTRGSGIGQSHKLWSSKLTIHILETQSKEQCMELMVPVLRSQEALEHCLFLWFQEHGTCHKIMHF